MSDDDPKRDAQYARLSVAALAFLRETRPLPLAVQPIDEAGNPVGPPLTTFEELLKSQAFADPVREACAEAYAAVKKAEELVRERLHGRSHGDPALRPVLAQLCQSSHHAYRAVEEWRPHEYPRSLGGAPHAAPKAEDAAPFKKLLVLIYGPRASGKSSLLHVLDAAFQAAGHTPFVRDDVGAELSPRERAEIDATRVTRPVLLISNRQPTVFDGENVLYVETRRDDVPRTRFIR